MFNLKGKVALVTGGNGGIGLGIARGLARAGAGIAVVGRNAEKNAAAVKELESLGVKAIGVVADVTDRKQVDRACRRNGCEARRPRHPGGQRRHQHPQETAGRTPSDEWHQVVDTNLTEHVHLLPGGCIPRW